MKHFLFLVLILVSGTTFSARADIVNQQVVIECLPELNVLKIRQDTINGVMAENASALQKEALLHKYGQIDIMDLFDFGPDYSGQMPKTFHTACLLKTTNRHNRKPQDLLLNITLEGQVENLNPSGGCGNWRSFYLTVQSGDKIYVDHLPFQESCNSGRHIDQIEINPQEEYTLVEAFHRMKQSTYWLSDKVFTVNPLDIYPPITDPEEAAFYKQRTNGKMIRFFRALDSKDWPAVAEESAIKGRSRAHNQWSRNSFLPSGNKDKKSHNRQDARMMYDSCVNSSTMNTLKSDVEEKLAE